MPYYFSNRSTKISIGRILDTKITKYFKARVYETVRYEYSYYSPNNSVVEPSTDACKQSPRFLLRAKKWPARFL